MLLLNKLDKYINNINLIQLPENCFLRLLIKFLIDLFLLQGNINSVVCSLLIYKKNIHERFQKYFFYSTYSLLTYFLTSA